jgi:putative RecB family exonuclease
MDVVTAPATQQPVERPPLGALSPSRVSDFKTCPLLFRFRAVDRLPEPPSPEATRGTLVHTVLEQLYDLPAEQRTPPAAHRLAVAAWEAIVAADPSLVAMVGPDDAEEWLRSVRDLLDTYFTLEDPRRLEPADRELLVEVELDDGLRLKGVLDRLDASPAGELRVVDYKTGRSPHPLFEQRALFQLRFYALLLWRARGHVPRLLQLIYLADGQVVRLEPHEADLRALERTLRAVAAAIERAFQTHDFRARRSALCGWCPHQALCPEFGGTPPPLPTGSGADEPEATT